MLDSIVNPVCGVFGIGTASTTRRKKKTRARRTYVPVSRPRARSRRAAAPARRRSASTRRPARY